MKFRSDSHLLAACLLLGMIQCAPSLAQSDVARLAALQGRVVALDHETAYVEAITKIQRLGKAFGYYTDKGYFSEAADLFTDDATFQWGTDGVYSGKARIRELLRQVQVLLEEVRSPEARAADAVLTTTPMT